MYVPPQLPMLYRPVFEALKAFGVPTVFLAWVLAQQAGWIGSEQTRAIHDHDTAARAAATARLELDRQRLEVDRLHAEALKLLREEMRKTSRVTRAICAEWGKLPDIRRACLEE